MSTINPIRVRFKKQHVSFDTNIVTNELLIFLNAGDTLSYPGSGDNWIDLSGNNYHMSLKNSPTFTTFNGAPCFDLNGTDDHGICDGTVIGSTAGTVTNLGVGGTNEKTVVCVACVDDGVGSSNGGMFDLGDSGSTGRQYSLRLNASYVNWRAQFWGDPDYDFTYDTRAKWTMFSVVYGSDKIGRTYRDNGVLLGQDSGAEDLTTAGARPFEMGRHAGGNYFGGKIGMYIVYNKGLTVEEIKQNYAAVKDRFGI
jgi:hypothetical protein